VLGDSFCVGGGVRDGSSSKVVLCATADVDVDVDVGVW